MQFGADFDSLGFNRIGLLCCILIFALLPGSERSVRCAWQ